MKKKATILLSLMLASVMFITPTRQVIVKAETTEPLVSEETSEDTPIITEIDSDITLVDADGNGIPDIIENYYDQNIREQYMFGISLGAIIGVLSSIATAVIMISKNAKSNKIILETNKKTESRISQLADENRLLRESIKQKELLIENQEKQYKETVANFEKTTQANLKRFEEASVKLEAYGQVEKKLDAVLEINKLIATTPEYVKLGIGEEIIKIIQEVK